MSLLGNIIWLVFGGVVTGLLYIIGGFLLCLTIVGIPFGLQSINLGRATLTPFGKTIRKTKSSGSLLRLVFDVLWLLLFGWEIAVAHLVSAAILAVTVLGMPLALQHVKLVPVALFPFNYELD